MRVCRKSNQRKNNERNKTNKDITHTLAYTQACAHKPLQVNELK